MNGNFNPNLFIARNPKSIFAEAIKNVRTNLAFSSVDKENKVILITSCEPSDGKSFFSSNLAVAYAQEDKNVLIIDCDLRKGSQHTIFNVPNGVIKGYSNLIIDYRDRNSNSSFMITDYILRTGVKNVSIIPTGPIPPNPTELLVSNNNREILRELFSMFDIVILDCPPVIGLSDALIMSRYSDVNLLVVAYKKTKLELINRVKKSFQNINANINGVVLNKVNGKDLKYGGYYSEKYYGESK